MKSIKINWHWMLAMVSMIVFALALWSLYHMLHNIRFADIKAAVHQLPTYDVIMALLVVSVGYIVLSFYDWVALRDLKIKVPFPHIVLTALTAYAIGHSVGLTVLSGGSIRYRLYSRVGLTAGQVGSVIVLTSMTFAFGIACMTGIALLLDPKVLADLTHLPMGVLRGMGVAILLAIAGLALWSGKTGKPLKLWNWIFSTPTGDTVLLQTAAASLDILMIVWALYILMPASAGLSYADVLAAFAFSTLIGILSNVPGGLGVFEASMALALPQVPKEALFGTLLVFRFMYYFLPFAISVVVLLVDEINQQARQVERGREAIQAVLRAWLPVIAASATGILGVMLLFEATSTDSGHYTLLGEFIPLPLIETSYLLSSAAGLGLIILARGLYQRLDGAWHLVVALLVVGIVATLLKRLDIGMVVLMLLVLGVLWLGHSAFHVHSSLMRQAFSPEWMALIGLVMVGFFWLGMVSQRYEALGSSQWWGIAGYSDVSRFLRTSVFLAVLVPTLALYKLLRRHEA